MSLLQRLLGLDRTVFDCFHCQIAEKESIYCLLHPENKLVSKTYLRKYKLYRKEAANNFFAIQQQLHVQVYCPVSVRCKEVRYYLNFLIFFLCENDISFFL